MSLHTWDPNMGLFDYKNIVRIIWTVFEKMAIFFIIFGLICQISAMPFRCHCAHTSTIGWGINVLIIIKSYENILRTLKFSLKGRKKVRLHMNRSFSQLLQHFNVKWTKILIAIGGKTITRRPLTSETFSAAKRSTTRSIWGS